MNKQEVKTKVEALLKKFATATSQAAYSSVIPKSLTTGKLYEAHVLSLIIEKLVVQEGYRVVLKNGLFLPLKSAPGPINRNYAYFELSRGGKICAEIWTDVEFLSLSYSQRKNTSEAGKGDYHELDIIVAEPNLRDRPRHSDIWLGVECKNTGYTKHLLREILGVRRELSLLRSDERTQFSSWPRAMVPAHPASCLMVYSTDQAVSSYSGPGEVFGIDFVHEPI